MRLFVRLSAFSFNLYCVKGRDMILSDYLSRHRQKDLDPTWERKTQLKMKKENQNEDKVN